MNNTLSNEIHTWKKVEQFNEKIKIDNQNIYLAGISYQNSDPNSPYKMASGSAGDPNASPLERAQYELLERIIIIENLNRQQFSYYDDKGNYLGEIGHKTVFPQSDVANWKYSLSNGLALHSESALARKSALCELIERDTVLRSWYGETKPQELKFSNSFVEYHSQLLKNSHEIKIYQFPVAGTLSLPIFVVGIFAFPKDDTNHFVYGFGARENLDEAISHAWPEMLQRMGFLFGEPVTSEEECPFTPTAFYHQEFYLRRVGKQLLKDWPTPSHLTCTPSLAFMAPNIKDVIYIDFSCPHISPYKVYKAYSPTFLPLIFGRNYSIQGLEIPSSLQIHPIV